MSEEIDVSALTDTEFFDLLNERLLMAAVASCTCGTKTDVAVHHAKQCRYRELVEARAALHVFRERYETTMREWEARRE